MEYPRFHELLSKRREEGTSYAFFSFTRKLGQTIAGAGSSALLALIGYDVKATDVGQSQEVIAKLYDISTLIPAIVLSLMFVLLAFGYKLSKSKLAEMQEALEKQRTTE